MEYSFREIEKKWQQKWIEDGVYKVSNDSSKPKYYVLDMFPYPSGAGLHVGHPLGYISSDIYARYKRLKGYNVLHPMGYDAFGLPAEQYAIEHGVHPAVSTEKNINTFRKQLDNIGFCYDWSREIRTSDPKYYKWTQWIFLQLFKSWYNRTTNKTEPIDDLIKIFEEEGNAAHPFPDAGFKIENFPSQTFTAIDWQSFNEKTQQNILMQYRIAYCGYGEVNWCEALGTVLANDEVVNGVSERGGYPVEKKRLRQWYLRITEYADRLLEGLNKVEFSDAMKEMQSNWIGKSEGAEITFRLTPNLSPHGEGSEKLSGKYFKTVAKESWQTLKEYGRANRKEPTEAENLLWQNLRNNQLNVKVRRQHAIQGYIADFVITEVKLVIETDGGYHDEKEQKIYDEARDKFLSELGFSVIRFTNNEVINNTDDVIAKIKSAIKLQKEKTHAQPGIPLLREEKGLGDEAEVHVFTTRPDTIFGVDFMVLAPEHELVEKITTPEQKAAVEEYITHVKSRSERERMAEKKISGVFTGAYVEHPFNEKLIPVWISEYVLAGYGTGAIMAVPSGDERDHKFAKHFNIPITNIVGDAYNGEEAYAAKDIILQNSDFLTGMNYRGATEVVLKKLEETGGGKRRVNYKMRDAAFSRQRYWGEPFPIKWIDGIAYPLDESELPLELPYVENYKPGPEGEGPLANIEEWKEKKVKLNLSESTKVSSSGGDLEGALETNTMPGYAGSSWYFLRYMDPGNDEIFCDKKVSDYWNQVDLYVGGTEHAVGHLLYSRMWTKALYDLGLISFDEPFKKLLNQGMIQGSSRYVYRIELVEEVGAAELINKLSSKNINTKPSVYLSYNLVERYFIDKTITLEGKEFLKKYISQLDGFEILQKEFSTAEISKIHVDVSIVDGIELDIKMFRKSKLEHRNAILILENGSLSSPEEGVQEWTYLCGVEIEKMSKRWLNVVNPDDVVDKYGADTFRMYEMFLGPVEMSKPWDTKGIEGVHRFLKKLWRLFWNDNNFIVTEEKATPEELKILHKTIKKIEEDTERFSFNTAVSAFMVCVNELTDLKCSKKEILDPLLILLTPYAPHVAEELWKQLKNNSTILDTSFPKLEEKYLIETTKEYPISINGKMRTLINIDLNATQEQVQEIVLNNEVVKKWMEDKPLKKLIFVKGKMVNVVV